MEEEVEEAATTVGLRILPTANGTCTKYPTNSLSWSRMHTTVQVVGSACSDDVGRLTYLKRIKIVILFYHTIMVYHRLYVIIVTHPPKLYVFPTLQRKPLQQSGGQMATKS